MARNRVSTEALETLNRYIRAFNALPFSGEFDSFLSFKLKLEAALAETQTRDREIKIKRKAHTIETENIRLVFDEDTYGVSLGRELNEIASLEVLEVIGDTAMISDISDLTEALIDLAYQKAILYEIITKTAPTIRTADEAFVELRRRTVNVRYSVDKDSVFSYKIVSGLDILEKLSGVPIERLNICESESCRNFFWAERLGTIVCSKQCGIRNRVARFRLSLYAAELADLEKMLESQQELSPRNESKIARIQRRIAKLHTKFYANES